MKNFAPCSKCGELQPYFDFVGRSNDPFVCQGCQAEEDQKALEVGGGGTDFEFSVHLSPTATLAVLGLTIVVVLFWAGVF